MLIYTPKRLTTVLAILGILTLAYVLPNVISWQPGGRANFWVLVLTAGAALLYAWLTYLLLRSDQRPVVVVAYEDARTVVRNFGRGAALNVSVTNDKGRTIDRVGNLAPSVERRMRVQLDWTIDEARYIFCQDVFGRWYGTKSLGQSLSASAELPIANLFLGRVFNPPPEARQAAMVRSAVEYWVQLNRSWDPRNWLRRLLWFVKKIRAERRIVRLIKSAIVDGRLKTSFTAEELSKATELERIVADRFLPNHAVGNLDNERPYFVAESGGRFRLKRRGE